jgi:hypothetical protein
VTKLDLAITKCAELHLDSQKLNIEMWMTAFGLAALVLAAVTALVVGMLI